MPPDQPLAEDRWADQKDCRVAQDQQRRSLGQGPLQGLLSLLGFQDALAREVAQRRLPEMEVPLCPWALRHWQPELWDPQNAPS